MSTPVQPVTIDWQPDPGQCVVLFTTPLTDMMPSGHKAVLIGTEDSIDARKIVKAIWPTATITEVRMGTKRPEGRSYTQPCKPPSTY